MLYRARLNEMQTGFVSVANRHYACRVSHFNTVPQSVTTRPEFSMSIRMSEDPTTTPHSSNSDAISESIVVESNLSEISAPVNAAQVDIVQPAPANPSEKINLLDLDRQQLREFFAKLGEKPFRADQVMKWMYHYCCDNFDEMTDINKVLRNKLKEIAEIRAPEVEKSNVQLMAPLNGRFRWATNG